MASEDQEFAIFSPFHKRLGGNEDEDSSAGKENDMQSLNFYKYHPESSRSHYSRSFCPNSTSETALSPIRKTKQKSKRTHRSLKKQGTATARATITPQKVTFRYDVKVAKIPEKKDWGSFMT